jgi:hypothetical protein
MLLITSQPLHTRNWQISTEVLKYLTCSFDLVPLDCYILPDFNKHLKQRTFLSTEVTLAVDGWFAAQPKEVFWMG